MNLNNVDLFLVGIYQPQRCDFYMSEDCKLKRFVRNPATLGLNPLDHSVFGVFSSLEIATETLKQWQKIAVASVKTEFDLSKKNLATFPGYHYIPLIEAYIFKIETDCTLLTAQPDEGISFKEDWA